jgi:multiple sugar transport system ATP-binding protein
MVFQSYALYPHMNVYDNLAFGLRRHNVPKPDVDRRVKNVAEVLGLQTLLLRKPRQLSGGEKQRVALGRAIVREPRVFLMDEPLSNLDARLRVQTRAELIKLHRRLQTTVVYVTHDQVEAMTMGSRIAVMRDGVLQQLDTPQAVYEHPANTFVAGFIGSPAMNFFDGQIVAEDERLFATTSSLRLEIPAARSGPLQSEVGREVIFGIRPEDIYHVTERPNALLGQRARVEVAVVEPLGSELFVYLEAGAHELTSRMAAGNPVRAGDSLEVVLDTRKLHVFDRETERAISSA